MTERGEVRSTEHRDCRCGGSGHWMQSRERGRRGKDAHKPLGDWRAGFLGWIGGVQGRGSLVLHNGERVEQVPAPRADLHCDELAFCMDEVWQRSGQPTGGGKPGGRDQGSRQGRRCEQQERPTEWQVRGSPSGTGIVIVKWYVWWRNAPGQNPR